MLKHRFEAVVLKKSVLEFQLEYFEFKLQYLDFEAENIMFQLQSCLKNTQKAGLQCESPALLLQIYDIFRRKANSVKIADCRIRPCLCVKKRRGWVAVKVTPRCLRAIR